MTEVLTKEETARLLLENNLQRAAMKEKIAQADSYLMVTLKTDMSGSCHMHVVNDAHARLLIGAIEPRLILLKQILEGKTNDNQSNGNDKDSSG